MDDINNVSLGSATGTRLDSGCKHIQQCRVSQDHLTRLAENGAESLLQRKFQYAVHKDELVLGVGSEWSLSPPFHGNNAYPRVISNLGDIEEDTKNLIKFAYHNIRSIAEREMFKKMFQNDNAGDLWACQLHLFRADVEPFIPIQPGRDAPDVATSLPVMFDCIPVGYSNTIGYAHRETGDTMTSVMIGGLRTVRNGDFEVHCGDLIQWYWPFERDCFTQDARRRNINPRDYLVEPNPDGTPRRVAMRIDNMDPASCPIGTDPQAPTPWSQGDMERDRQKFYERQYGNVAAKGKQKGHSKLVPFIKPYRPDEFNPRLYDWVRVFAVAIGSAGPHQDLDIKISRQSV